MIQPFDLIFYRGTSPIDRLIEWGGQTEFSHVALVLNDLHTLEEDYKTPTQIKHFSYPKGSYVVKRLKQTLTENQKVQIMDFVISNVDKHYDFTYLFTRFFHRLLGTPIAKTPDRYTCDELVVDAFLTVGIELVYGLVMTPGTLALSPLLETVMIGG